MSEQKENKKDSNKKIKNNLEKYELKITELETELEKTKEDHIRIAADYSNLVRRTDQEKQMILELGNEKLLKSFLEILDDLEASAEHTEEAGIKNILIKFRKILEEAGLEEIESLNEDFDPNLHEAIETTEGPENKVIKVFRKGYKSKNKILRPSLVSVGNGS